MPAARRIDGDLLAQPLAQAGVERGERLVEQHDLGVGGQRAGERDALALAAGQLVRVVLGAVREPDELEALGQAPVRRRAEADVAGDRQVREQRALLEDHADAARLGLDPLAGAGDRAAADPHAAGVGPLEAGDQPQQRRLARAARAEHGEEAAALEPQVDAVDGEPLVEAAREAVCLDRWRLLGHRRQF